ncbi:MAG: hypothetical protein ACRD3O_06540 [Terriglobia bacterium]
MKKSTTPRECLLAGDIQTGMAVLRDYINATVGLVALAEAPQGRNLFEIVGYPQRRERVSFHLKVRGAA